MKRLLLIFAFLPAIGFTQSFIDSLYNAADNADSDTAKAMILYEIGVEVLWSNPEECVNISDEILSIGEAYSNDLVKG